MTRTPAKPAAPNLGLKTMTKAAREAWIRTNPGKTPRSLGWKRGAGK